MTLKPTLLVSYVVLQALDVLSTMHFLSTGHGVETNPVMLFSMEHLGVWWWTPKLAIVLATLPILSRARLRYVAGMTSFYAFVVVNNLML